MYSTFHSTYLSYIYTILVYIFDIKIVFYEKSKMASFQ